MSPIKVVGIALVIAATILVVVLSVKQSSPQSQFDTEAKSVPLIQSPSVLQTHSVGKARSQPESSRDAASNDIYSIDFGDGDRVPVDFRQYQWPEPIQITSLEEQYRELIRRAEDGDASAALALSEYLANCESYGYESEEEYRSAIAGLESEHMLPMANGDGKIQISPDPNGEVDIIYWREVISTAYESCKGIPSDVVERRQELLKLAASKGSLPAIKTLARSASNEAEKMALYQKLWEAGDYNAALWLGYGYKKGWNGQTDQVLSFAYTLLGLELTRIAMTNRNGVVYPQYGVIAQDTDIRSRARTLSHDQYARAIETAKDLLVSNDLCCYLFGEAENAEGLSK